MRLPSVFRITNDDMAGNVRKSPSALNPFELPVAGENVNIYVNGRMELRATEAQMRSLTS